MAIQVFQGSVKFYKKDKGFGFITDVLSGKDIFVHASGLKNPIKEGDIVNYNTVMGKKGENIATNVMVI